MSDILHRQPARALKKNVGRLLVGIAGLLGASAGWYLLRPTVVDLVVRSSFGCEARRGVIASALLERYPNYPVQVLGRWHELVSYCRPSPGTVAWWRTDQEAQEPPFLLKPPKPRIVVFADANLDYLGSFRSTGLTPYGARPPADRDRDGRYETTHVGHVLQTTRSAPEHTVIIRLGEQASQVAALLIVGPADVRTGAAVPVTYVLWRDEDGDGLDELVVRRVEFRRPPKPGFGTPETLGVLAWDRPGGVLRPRQLPDDGSILVWTPVDGRPYEFPADAIVDDICQELLPVPEGFGAQPTSQPASQPATESATQPGSP